MSITLGILSELWGHLYIISVHSPHKPTKKKKMYVLYYKADGQILSWQVLYSNIRFFSNP